MVSCICGMLWLGVNPSSSPRARKLGPAFACIQTVAHLFLYYTLQCWKCVFVGALGGLFPYSSVVWALSNQLTSSALRIICSTGAFRYGCGVVNAIYVLTAFFCLEVVQGNVPVPHVCVCAVSMPCASRMCVKTVFNGHHACMLTRC